MSLEVSGSEETPFTRLALVRPFAGVRSNVFDENHLRSEVLVADVALKPTFSCRVVGI